MRRREKVIDVGAPSWWPAVVRDGQRCRVAPFLPDLPCSGSLDVYNPSCLDDPEPAVDAAVTACDGHKAWVRDNFDDARALGLVRAGARPAG